MECVPKKYGRVLIVDDNEINRKLMSRFLKEYFNEIVIACDGLEAVKKFKSKKFEAVFLDLKMPKMDGKEALKEMKKINKEVPIVIVTAIFEKEEKEKVLELGAIKIIEIPVTQAVIKKVVMDILE